MTDVVCYYHDPIKAPLLREAVLPALRDVAVDHPAVSVHLERHWLHGPHIRIRLHGTGQDTAATAVAERLTRYVADHPSTVAVSDAELLAQAEAAGRAELIAPPYPPIHPDNTVCLQPSDTSALLALLGSDEAVRCRTRVLRLGLPAVAASLDRLAAGDDTSAARIRLTVAAMAAHAGRYPHGLGGGYQSFLSHVEEFLLQHDPDRRLRERFERTWQDHAKPMAALVARLAGADPVDQAERAWLEWTELAAAQAAVLYDTGLLTRQPGPGYRQQAEAFGDEALARQWNHTERTGYSDYHRALHRVSAAAAPHERDLAVYRFTTNMLYLLLALCDVTPLERYLAAYLLSQAAELVTGLTWRERLDRIAATR